MLDIDDDDDARKNEEDFFHLVSGAIYRVGTHFLEIYGKTDLAFQNNPN